MIRLFFYVEGQTEQQYAETLLRQHLAGFDVQVMGAVLAATRRRHHVVKRGGGRHYLPMKNDLVRLLRQHRGQDVRFTTMFDLYALYSDFPGTPEAEKVKHLPYARVNKLEEAYSADLGDTRLIPHLQQHEFETILYCQLNAFEIYYDDCRRQIEALEGDAGELLATPELIDDGQESAPSKRIAKQFPNYPAAKPDAAVAIASIIGLATIRARCPHFESWLKKLEKLNQGAP